MLRTLNKYDIFIILLISSLAFGQVGGFLQIVRFLAICFSPLALINLSKKSYTPYTTFFTLLFIYATLSLCWSANPSEGVKRLSYLIVHSIAFLEIIVFSKKANHSISSISTGWLIAVILTLGVAFWEISTDNHLPYSKFDEAKEMHTSQEVILRHFATVTFFNPNGYVTFLCFALPFIFQTFYNSEVKGSLQKIISASAIISTSVVILYNASRGGFLSLIVMFFIFLFNNKKGSITQHFLQFILLLSAFIIFKYGESFFYILSVRMNEGVIMEDESRLTIWMNCWKAFTPTIGFGVGIGGIANAMKQVTNGILVPHNIFIEVLMEYGAIFFIVFVSFYLKITKKAFLNPLPEAKWPLLMALLTLPIYGIINSGYLTQAFVFIAFASIITLSDYNNSSMKNIKKKNAIFSHRK